MSRIPFLFFTFLLGTVYAAETPISQTPLTAALLRHFDLSEFVVTSGGAPVLRTNGNVWCVVNTRDDIAISIEAEIRNGQNVRYEQLAFTDEWGNLHAVIDPVRSTEYLPYPASVVLPRTAACGRLPKHADGEEVTIGIGVAFTGLVTGEDGIEVPIGDEDGHVMFLYGAVELEPTELGLKWLSDVERHNNGRQGAQRGICTNPIEFNEPNRVVGISLQCPSNRSDPKR